MNTHPPKETKKERAPRDRLGKTKVFATSQLAELFFIASKKTARFEQWQREGRKPTQRRVPSPHFRRGLLLCPKEAACLLTGRHHAPDRPSTEPQGPCVLELTAGLTAAGARRPQQPRQEVVESARLRNGTDARSDWPLPLSRQVTRTRDQAFSLPMTWSRKMNLMMGIS